MQFVRGLHTLYDAGARVFVEVGPEEGPARLRRGRPGRATTTSSRCSPTTRRTATSPSFNAALCGLWAAGLGYRPADRLAADRRHRRRRPAAAPARSPRRRPISPGAPARTPSELRHAAGMPAPRGSTMSTDRTSSSATSSPTSWSRACAAPARPRRRRAGHVLPAFPSRSSSPVPRSACPACEHVFDDENLQRILDGQQFIDTIPHRFRQQMVDMHITRLVKRESGDPTFEAIDDEADVVKLAGTARTARRRRGVRRRPRPRRGARRGDPAGDRCRLRRDARRRHPAGDALQDDQSGLAACPSAGGCPTPCATTPA